MLVRTCQKPYRFVRVHTATDGYVLTRGHYNYGAYTSLSIFTSWSLDKCWFLPRLTTTTKHKVHVHFDTQWHVTSQFTRSLDSTQTQTPDVATILTAHWRDPRYLVAGRSCDRDRRTCRMWTVGSRFHRSVSNQHKTHTQFTWKTYFATLCTHVRRHRN